MKCLYMLFVFEITSSRIFQTSIACAAEKHEQYEQKQATGTRISEWGLRHPAPSQVSFSGRCSSVGKGQVKVSHVLSGHVSRVSLLVWLSPVRP